MNDFMEPGKRLRENGKKEIYIVPNMIGVQFRKYTYIFFNILP